MTYESGKLVLIEKAKELLADSHKHEEQHNTGEMASFSSRLLWAISALEPSITNLPTSGSTT